MYTKVSSGYCVTERYYNIAWVEKTILRTLEMRYLPLE